ncbi:dolichol kinase [Pleurotus ostreatus]|nr:dolichol kinase [Pleurotus ostreatus]
MSIYIDARRGAECLILLASTVVAAGKIASLRTTGPAPYTYSDDILWASIELWLLSIASFIYIIWAHTSISKHPSVSAALPKLISFSPLALRFHYTNSGGRPTDVRETKRSPAPPVVRKSDFGFIWMSVPKNYRESSDDGILTALLFGPLIASALLYSSLQRAFSPSNQDLLPTGWLIEPPIQLPRQTDAINILGALIGSRFNILDISTLCSTLLLIHVWSSSWLEAQHSRRANAPEGERSSVPRSEGSRLWYYVLFTIGVSSVVLGLNLWLESAKIGLWQHMSQFELLVCSFFYQFTLYAALRLAHRGFTIGELGLVCFGGTALFMELLNITMARIWPVTTPYIKTYRLPTPLLVFQVALIAGSFLTGFMLSPFLILSRHIAQRPVRRLRRPEEKLRQRRQLALGFYVGTVLIVVGLIGMWARWCLGDRDPWLWAVFFLLEGRRKWSRPVLLAYWGLLVSLSVAGWNRQLARSRRFKPRSATSDGVTASETNTTSQADIASTNGASPGPLSLTFPNLNALPNASQVTTDLLDAADKHVPTLSLNARRKYFHALAVVMFVPGVAIDPAFTHLSLSVAFAVFTFAEYIRYFAVYPFGAAIHVFMNDFLDHKDSGTAILSHFYLLTGCAGSLWLEGPSHLSQFTGILTIGVGDALASIIGKRFGTHRWSPTSPKTVEGSMALTVSVVASAWLLRILGLVEPFSTVQYAATVAISSVLEALSVQNDNLTLPLFMWSILQFLG